MRPFIFIILVFSALSFPTSAQTHFREFKAIKYQSIPFESGTLKEDSTRIISLNLSKIAALTNIRIDLQEIKDRDSLNIFIYNQEALVQKFLIPYPIWHLVHSAYIADIDGNGMPDIKLLIGNSGSGLASLLETKIYLFNLRNVFKMVSFFDFSTEDEYDLNGDGVYEIISQNHVYKNNHSYWVHNVYNFKADTLVNVSKKYNYPLWTKHLFSSSSIVAKNISYTERLKEFRIQPDDLIIE